MVDGYAKCSALTFWGRSMTCPSSVDEVRLTRGLSFTAQVWSSNDMVSRGRKFPVWAVMCGALRRITEFKISILELLRLRDEGVIDAVVLSTWEGEIDKHEDLRSSLLGSGVILIESAPPSDSGDFHIYAQHKAFLEGLDACPAEALIFKSRTDRSFELTWTFLEQMRFGLPEAEPSFGLDACLTHKVGCLRISPSMPFYVADFTFLAYHRDCRRLLNFELFYDQFCMMSPMLPEVRWFASPFLRESAHLTRSFRELRLLEISMSILEHARSGSREPLPDLIIDLLALSLALVDGHFLTTRSDEAPTHLDPGLLFRPQLAPSAGIETINGYMWSIVNSSHLIGNFLRNGATADSPYSAIASRCADGLGGLAQSIPATSSLEAVDSFVKRWGNQPAVGNYARPCQRQTIATATWVKDQDPEALIAPWRELEFTVEEYQAVAPEVRRLAGGYGVGAALREEGKRLLKENPDGLERRSGLRLLNAAAELLDFDACLYLAKFYLECGDQASFLRHGESALAIAKRSISWRVSEVQELLTSGGTS